MCFYIVLKAMKFMWKQALGVFQAAGVCVRAGGAAAVGVVIVAMLPWQ